jgi:site-specific recombinase XerD
VNPSGPIFHTYADPVTNRLLKEVAIKCGIKKRLTFHISRHTFGTLFLERGGRVEVLKELMGHSDIDTTMVYVHMSDKRKTEQKKEAFDKVDYL